MNENTGDSPKLVLLTGKQKGTDLLLTADTMVIGRTEEADLVVRDKSISRRHATFARTPGGWVVRDLESKNGIKVNNREANEQGLRTGDVVTIGNVKLKFIDPKELAPIGSQPPADFIAPSGQPGLAPMTPQPGFGAPPVQPVFQQPGRQDFGPPPFQPGFPQQGPQGFGPPPVQPGYQQQGQQGFGAPPVQPGYQQPGQPGFPPPQIQPGSPQFQVQPGFGAPVVMPAFAPPQAEFPPASGQNAAPVAQPKPEAQKDAGVYVPQLNVRADLYSPPPEFYAPPVPVKNTGPGDSPLTRRKLVLYLAAFGVVGALLGYLLYITFGPKYEPFNEAAKLAVREIKLVDMDKYWSDIKVASVRVDTARVASASYDSGLGILKVEGKALGTTDVVFLDKEGKLLGRVGVHVLEGERQKRFVDRASMTEEQLVTRAKDLMVEGDTLAKAHIAQAILKYEMACELLEWVTDDSVKAIARLKLSDLVEEREKRFRKLRDRYVQANKLGDLPAARDLLDEICDIFPDDGDERHQQAKIFLKRIERRQAAQKRSQ